MKNLFTTRKMVLMALLIAVSVLLRGPFAITTPIMRLTLDFIPAILIGALFGPVGAGIALMLVDVLNFMLFVTFPFFIGFTIQSGIAGVLYGLFFYKKEITLTRAIVSSLVISTLITLIMAPINLMILMGTSYWSLLPPRLVQWAVFTAIQIFVTYAVIPRITNLPQFKRYISLQDSK